MIKSFGDPFADIALTFPDTFPFNSVWTSACFLFFEVTFFFSLLSKSAFFTKLGISFLLTKLVCANLAVKYSSVNLLNYWVVIYLSWSWSVLIFSSISVIFVCMLLSCHVRVSEWIHILQLPKCQATWNRRSIWSLSDNNKIRTGIHLVCKRTLNHLSKLVSLAKCLWVQIPSQSLYNFCVIVSFFFD